MNKLKILLLSLTLVFLGSCAENSSAKNNSEAHHNLVHNIVAVHNHLATLNSLNADDHEAHNNWYTKLKSLTNKVYNDSKELVSDLATKLVHNQTFTKSKEKAEEAFNKAQNLLEKAGDWSSEKASTFKKTVETATDDMVEGFHDLYKDTSESTVGIAAAKLTKDSLEYMKSSMNKIKKLKGELQNCLKEQN